MRGRTAATWRVWGPCCALLQINRSVLEEVRALKGRMKKLAGRVARLQQELAEILDDDAGKWVTWVGWVG